MKQKGFTLIELLVVVAIIGILAAAGVVAYNGYTNSAKKNAAKSNLDTVYKYLSGEIMKCEIGEEKILGSYLSRLWPIFFGLSIFIFKRKDKQFFLFILIFFTTKDLLYLY